MSQSRECLNCHKDINHLPGQSRYCSRTCYEEKYYGSFKAEAKALIKEKSCENCKQIFKPKTRRITRFCSINCIYEARNKALKVELEVRMCENCGEEFKPTRAFQVFCSPKCRNKTTYLKKMTGMSAQDLRSLEPVETMPQKLQKELDLAHAESLAKEMEEQDLPLCSRCAVNKVKDPEAPYMQCDECIKITEAENVPVQH